MQSLGPVLFTFAPTLPWCTRLGMCAVSRQTFNVLEALFGGVHEVDGVCRPDTVNMMRERIVTGLRTSPTSHNQFLLSTELLGHMDHNLPDRLSLPCDKMWLAGELLCVGQHLTCENYFTAQAQAGPITNALKFSQAGPHWKKSLS